MKQNDAEKNIISFIEKYGQDGFLELYFTNLLYEMVKENIHTKSNSIKDSPGLQYYFDKDGNFINNKKLKEFDQSLKKECSKKAKLVVNHINQKELISKFGLNINNITSSISSEINKQIKDIFKIVFGIEWGGEIGK